MKPKKEPDKEQKVRFSNLRGEWGHLDKSGQVMSSGSGLLNYTQFIKKNAPLPPSQMSVSVFLSVAASELNSLLY